MFEEADEIGPKEGYGEYGEEPFNPVDVCEVSVLNVEAAELQ